MRSLFFGPIIRSLLIGVVTVVVTVSLYWVGGVGFYSRHVGGLLGLPKNLDYNGEVVIHWITLAWVALSIGGSYMWHTRHLDRKTATGNVSEILMWLLYALLLLLALLIWFFMPEPPDPNQRPFMD